MKKDEIRRLVADDLAAKGYGRHMWGWSRAVCCVLVGTTELGLKLPAPQSRRRVLMALDRVPKRKTLPKRVKRREAVQLDIEGGYTSGTEIEA